MLSWALPSNQQRACQGLACRQPGRHQSQGQDTWHFGEPPPRLQPLCSMHNVLRLPRPSAPWSG